MTQTPECRRIELPPHKPGGINEKRENGMANDRCRSGGKGLAPDACAESACGNSVPDAHYRNPGIHRGTVTVRREALELALALDMDEIERLRMKSQEQAQGIWLSKLGVK